MGQIEKQILWFCGEITPMIWWICNLSGQLATANKRESRGSCLGDIMVGACTSWHHFILCFQCVIHVIDLLYLIMTYWDTIWDQMSISRIQKHLGRWRTRVVTNVESRTKASTSKELQEEMRRLGDGWEFDVRRVSLFETPMKRPMLVDHSSLYCEDLRPWNHRKHMNKQTTLKGRALALTCWTWIVTFMNRTACIIALRMSILQEQGSRMPHQPNMIALSFKMSYQPRCYVQVFNVYSIDLLNLVDAFSTQGGWQLQQVARKRQQLG